MKKIEILNISMKEGFISIEQTVKEICLYNKPEWGNKD